MPRTEGARARTSSVFTLGEPIWAGRDDGPKYGQTVWDMAPINTRTSAAQRRIDLGAIPPGYRHDVMDILTILAQPGHEAVLEAGVVRRGDGATTAAICDVYTCLRTIAIWAEARGLRAFPEWRQRDADALVVALQHGTHREDGHGVKPSTVRGYIDALRFARDFHEGLSGGLGFQPWGARSAANVAGDENPLENLTAPMPWEMWAPLVAASWAFVDRFSVDILRAVDAYENLPARPVGPSGNNAWRALQDWDARGGAVPLHSGFGRYKVGRGEPNKTLLFRLLGLNDSIVKPANRNYRREADEMITEIGLGEAERLTSVLRAACYVIIGSLTGMRDGEIQELRREHLATWHGIPAIRSVQFKGRDDHEGEARYWWAPPPVMRACEVLAQLTPHPTHLFARDAANAGAYDSSRDVPRLVTFVNDDPMIRPGRGNGLALAPIVAAPGVGINALTLRRSFAVYATTKPGAELGLGIQLGHSAWRVTTGYFSDGQERAVQHMNDVRKSLLREQAAALVLGTTPVGGKGAEGITAFRAQIVDDPERAERIIDAVADRLYPGQSNDCMWNESTAGCEGDRPRLGDHLCIGLDCSNTLFYEVHANLARAQIARIDGMLARGRGNESLLAQMRRTRANIARRLRELEPDIDEEEIG
jgi:integrase